MQDDPAETEHSAPVKTPLINRAKVRDLALTCAQHRARKFDRVSAEFYVGAEACLRNWVASRVANAPSLGMTLR